MRRTAPTTTSSSSSRANRPPSRIVSCPSRKCKPRRKRSPLGRCIPLGKHRLQCGEWRK